MRVLRTSIAMASVAATLALLTGCSAGAAANSSTSESPVVEPTGTAEAEISSTPSPTPALTDFSNVFEVKDKAGYTFSIPVTYSLLTADLDPSSQKPGLTAVNIGLRLSIGLQNTTTAREVTFASARGIVSPFDEPVIVVSATYPADSPVCTIRKPSIACQVQLGFARITETLAPDESVDLTTYVGLENSSSTPAVAGIPEAMGPSVVEALANPDGYLLTYGGGDTDRFTDVCDYTGPGVLYIAYSGNGCALTING